ncbi:MAG: PfkB family carbohydrate kinase [Pseudomonadota bacterium]
MIVVGGENLIDLIEEGGAPGAPLYRAAVGGSPLNTAKAAARQDVPVGYLTPVSSDTLGRLIAEDLRRDAVRVLAPASDRPTSLAVVSFNEGQPAYQFYREHTAERDVSEEGLAAALPDDTDVLYVGSLALAGIEDGAAWTELYQAASERGIFTALDPNVRPTFIRDRAAYLARLETLFSASRLIKLSDEDLGWLTGGAPPRDAATSILARSAADVVILTQGDAGAVGLLRGGGVVDVPAHPVPNLVDTVGAGDTFMGTILAQARNGGLTTPGVFAAAEPAEVHRLLAIAARAAAINCGRVGCNPPTAAELFA